MGTINFEIAVMTNADLTTAYRDAVSDASSSYGSHPYSGSIATTNGVHAHPTHTQPLSEDVARRVSGSRLDGLDKRGDAEALPLAAEEDVVTRTITVKVSIPDGGHHRYDSVETAVCAAARTECTTGENVASWETPEWVVEMARSATIASGTATTRYYVTTRDAWGDRQLRGFGVSANGYATKAEARAAAIAAARQATDAIAMTVTARREIDGDPGLVTVTARPTSASATVKVTLHRTKTGAKRAGWLLYGKAPW